ncbi:MAG: HAD family phosphatase [Oscillospiraceae bacterium]|nr:HAD family phosphatase [Oscillospiraceae bacterium]
MSRQFQLIAFDVDGTLVNSRKELTPAVKDAVRKARSLGKHIVLSTGRTVDEVRPLMRELEGVDISICTSGSLIYDFGQDKIISRKSLPEEAIMDIYEVVGTKDVMVQCMSEGHSVIAEGFLDRLEQYHMEQYRPLYTLIGTWVPDIWEYILHSGHNVEKINVYHRTVEDRADSMMKLRDNAEHVYSEVTSIETTSLGVDKGQGLREVCGYLGIPIEETIAAGDADNDLSLLKAAGLAVAMGNANDNVRRASDVTVADNDHDGAAEAMLRYLIG